MNYEVFVPEISEKIIEKIRKLRYDPTASCSYEVMSGGLIWADEITNDIQLEIMKHSLSGTFRCLFAYRASLIKGQEICELRPIWEKMINLFPNWPFFKEERKNKKLISILSEETNKTAKELSVLVPDFKK